MKVRLKVLAALLVMAFMVAACGGAAAPAAEPTAAPAAEEPAAEPTAAPVAEEPTAAPADDNGGLAEVAREDTLNLAWSIANPGVTNPWASVGYTHQNGNALLWEPLAYYAIYADKPVMWLADSMEYTKPDFTELTIKMNKDAKWSDGVAVTADDVVFTFEGQMKNEKLGYHAQFKEYVKEVKKVDDLTVVVTFNFPAPRFSFEVLHTKFDTGIPIVPAHVLSTQADVNEFPGGLDMPHSGGYNVVLWDENQKIMDVREDWWAVAAGKASMPEVKRVVITNIGGTVGQNMDVVAQKVVNNEYDATLDMRSSVIGNILAQNPKVTTHTGSNPPYGYLDWWPNSLWMNTQIAPYNDVRVRRAISLAVDRATINEVVYEGAEVATIYPFPMYPGLQKFADTPGMKALVEQLQPGKFDLAESEKLMTEAGFAKNADGLWEKDGKTVNAVINGFEGIHSDIVPVLVEMLKAAGFDADVNFGSDAYQNMADGKEGLYMFGHGASLGDPEAALQLYHSRYSAAIGTTAGGNRFSRYKNEAYDKIVDEMAPLDASDPKFTELATQAMEIYWSEQIDVPVIQWLHRIPYNQTYWTNWPTADNPANGINGAFWHHTFPLVITGLKKAGN
jgi:ABC-type transport system substrate-binding protein